MQLLRPLSNESIFNIIDNESVFKIDLIVRKKDEFAIEQFKRRQTKYLGSFAIDVISPEDLILSKLIWSKRSGSVMQERDISNIFNILGRQLDGEYIKNWAKHLGVLAQLERFYGST